MSRREWVWLHGWMICWLYTAYSIVVWLSLWCWIVWFNGLSLLIFTAHKPLLFYICFFVNFCFCVSVSDSLVHVFVQCRSSNQALFIHALNDGAQCRYVLFRTTTTTTTAKYRATHSQANKPAQAWALFIALYKIYFVYFYIPFDYFVFLLAVMAWASHRSVLSGRAFGLKFFHHCCIFCCLCSHVHETKHDVFVRLSSLI